MPIRLTDERWRHIVESRDEMAGYRDDCPMVIEEPDLVLQGYQGALIAVKGYGGRRYRAIVYRELSQQDGFVISACFTSRINGSLIVWQP